MVAKRLDAGDNRKRRRPPATTPEARQQQLEAYAYDLAERQLLDGTASSQLITHFLKSSSQREKLELERIRNDNLLTEAKIKQLDSQQGSEKLLREAMRAFTEYKGHETEDEEDA